MAGIALEGEWGSRLMVFFKGILYFISGDWTWAWVYCLDTDRKCYIQTGHGQMGRRGGVLIGHEHKRWYCA